MKPYGIGIGIPFAKRRGWDYGNSIAFITGNMPITKSNYITELAPTYTYATRIFWTVGNTGEKTARALLDCNFDYINDNDVIVNAKLRLTRYGTLVAASNARKIQVFRLKRSWIAGDTTGVATNSSSNWLTADGVNNWGSAGAFSLSDCEQTPIGEIQVAADHDGEIIIPISVSSKSELTLGYGFLIKMETELNDAHYWCTIHNATASLRPYLEIEMSHSIKLINGVKSPLFEKSSENPVLTGRFGSVWYNGVGDYVFFYSDGTNVNRAVSTDGLIWTGSATVMTPNAGVIDVVYIWKETTWYMLYRSSEWGGYKSIGLATSVDGITWTKSDSNPIITNADLGDWSTAGIDPWGVIKIGDIYYLWVNDVGETPRQTGLLTSTDLINWIEHESNPIFGNGRFCGQPIKYKGYYYMFINYIPYPDGTSSTPIYHRLELYRDSEPTFLPDSREFLGNILYGGEEGTWEDYYIDTPSIITDNINRDTFPTGNKLHIYYSGASDISTWSHGLAIGNFKILEKLIAVAEPPPNI